MWERSAGVRQPSVLRGRLLRAAATAARSSTLCLDRSVPLGKYCRSTCGYTVVGASSPLDALQILRERSEPIDLVVTDVVLPQMNGTVLVRALTELLPELRVLYMSGYTDGKLDNEKLGESGHAFIAKPFRPHELTRRVREVLDARLEPTPPSLNGGRAHES